MKKILLFATTLVSLTTQAAEQDSINTRVMDEAVVTGTRQQAPLSQIPMTVSIVDNNQLNQNYRQNVLPTLMEQVPGLMLTSRGMMGYGVSTGAAGGLNLRGLSAGAGQLMVLIDGHPQYAGVFGHSIADSYQTMMAERVEVLRGPASLLYGSNAMGGVINIITRKTKEDGVTNNINLGAGSWGTIQADATNQVRKGRFSSTVALQYGRSDNHRPNMGFEQYGGFVKLGYELNEHWNTMADLNITHFNASNPGTVDKPMFENDQYITRYAANLVLENKYKRSSGAVSIYDNYGRHKINDGYAAGGTPQTDLFRSRDAVSGFSAWQNFVLNESDEFGTNLTAGLDYQHIYGRAWYTNRETGATVTTGNRKMQSTHTHENEWAGYADLRQGLSRYVTINAGIRFDNHSTAGSEWIPQAGIIVRPIKTGELKASASKGFRNPTIKEMFLYGPANDSLKAERMWNYELSWSHHLLEGRLSYGINLFHTDGDNMIQQLQGMYNPQTGKMLRLMNTGKFHNNGVEVEARWAINSHWSVNTNHSYLHMKTPVIGAPEYKGYVGAQMEYGKWSLVAGLQQLSGLYKNTTKVDRENATLLNMTVNYQPMPCLRLWVKGDNLLAQHYEINEGYPMPRATFMAGVNVRF